MQYYIAQKMPGIPVEFKYLKKNYSDNFIWTLNPDDIYYFDTIEAANLIVNTEGIKKPFIFSSDPKNGKYDKNKAYDDAMRGI